MRNVFSLIVVVVSLFLMPAACSSSSQEGNGGTGGGPHGDKPSAIQLGCPGQNIQECTRYKYNSHGDVERVEHCKNVSCQQWCDQPEIDCSIYEYDDKGRILVYWPSHDCSMVAGSSYSKFTYEGDGKGWVTAKDDSGSINNCRVLTYTAQGEIETSLDVDCQTKKGLRCDRYAYDQQGRLVEQTYGATCEKQDQVACIKQVYEGDIVKGLVGDGNCENMTQVTCSVYYY